MLLGQAVIENLNAENRQLTFTWEVSEAVNDSSGYDATGYDYQILPEGEPVHHVGDSPPGEASISITGLSAGTYQLQIRATGGDDIIPGIWSESRSFEVSSINKRNIAEKIANKVEASIEEAEPKNVIQSYDDNTLTVSWEPGLENKHYDVKVVDEQNKKSELSSTSSDSSPCSFDIAGLSSSGEGRNLITAVRTIISERVHTPYVYAEASNYQLGQAKINTLAYNSSNGMLTGAWTPPDSEDPGQNATGYEYQIEGTDLSGAGKSTSEISIPVKGLAPGPYNLQIRATGQDTTPPKVIPGAWSEPQSFAIPVAPITASNSPMSIVIPSTVNRIRVEIAGGQGGELVDGNYNQTLDGGKGFHYKADIPVDPGSTIIVYAGAQGSQGNGNPYPRGSQKGGGGGNASSIHTIKDGEKNWLIVAGGGGGAYFFHKGCDALGSTNGGGSCSQSGANGGGGKDGNHGAHGAAGATGGDGIESSGVPPIKGGSGSQGDPGAGGGGGGYSGGGGGGTSQFTQGSGGGGGSYYISGATIISKNADNQKGGFVNVSFLT